mmetsp:Transcript_7949/g.20012  ORF Transcript_7949/g.20012 Transcript_7949/m.20012 type:complete len:307 (-) Transcript_7949:345-1265(-)
MPGKGRAAGALTLPSGASSPACRRRMNVLSLDRRWGAPPPATASLLSPRRRTRAGAPSALARWSASVGVEKVCWSAGSSASGRFSCSWPAHTALMDPSMGGVCSSSSLPSGLPPRSRRRSLRLTSTLECALLMGGKLSDTHLAPSPSTAPTTSRLAEGRARSFPGRKRTPGKGALASLLRRISVVLTMRLNMNDLDFLCLGGTSFASELSTAQGARVPSSRGGRSALSFVLAVGVTGEGVTDEGVAGEVSCKVRSGASGSFSLAPLRSFARLPSGDVSSADVFLCLDFKKRDDMRRSGLRGDVGDS